MGFVDEIKAWNFSIYAQWFGIISIILDFVLGFVNLFHIGSIVVFSVLSLVMGFILMFVEIPFLTRICPTSQKFDSFIQYFNQNWPRAGVYIIFSTILFLSGIIKLTSLIVAGFFMTIACLCYVIAALKGQTFTNSSLLGGPGITQMVV
ncbi:uncharacterized protein T551_02431 [Pneumocystis jirovecii RU7]|uniref:Golgi apparatus membrane protein TVP18 n=1 Tax=Pneumocystis jirovecii (strain RU7) TaxID=1408657 RepID=A0A0W4ZLA4_PNEJ7|nr:uncharacterized protein T551_02431 [Pneumocystis jirovecii RU7]KTW29157.1 hypothetical protein T551_02431 [Pneumocystis jirovecii RU7]